MCSRFHSNYSIHTLEGDDGLLDGHFLGDVLHWSSVYAYRVVQIIKVEGLLI